MSFPIGRRKYSDPALDYAPPWARDQVRPILGYSSVPSRIEERPRDQGPDDADHAVGDDDVEIEVQSRRTLAPDPIPQLPLGTPNLLPSVLKMCAVWGIAAVAAWVLITLAGVSQSGTEIGQGKGAPPPIAANSVEPLVTAVPSAVSDGSASVNEPQRQTRGSILAANKSPAPLEVAAADKLPETTTSMPATSYAPRPAAVASEVNEQPPRPAVSTPAANYSPPPAGTAVVPTANGPPSQLVTPVPTANSPPSAGATAVPATTESAPPPKIGTVPPAQTSGIPAALDDDEIIRLVKRGKDFLKNGDFISARLLLQRAADAGSAEAALALGSTFDPFVIKRLGAIAIKPDVDLARKWYQRAADLGSPLASLQLANLARAR